MDTSPCKKLFHTWYEPMERWGMFTDFGKLIRSINQEYENNIVYPAKKNVFRAFRATDYEDLKIIILGQDPYHDGSATGLCFGNEGDTTSPSLQILMQEWSDDPCIKLYPELDKSLLHWTAQGILLLNCSLTVKEGDPLSHQLLWNIWTQTFITALSKEKKNLVWLLLGRKAQAWKKYMVEGWLVEAPHPAAETYSGGTSGFLGSKIFSQVNDKLGKLNKKKIHW